MVEMIELSCVQVPNAFAVELNLLPKHSQSWQNLQARFALRFVL